MAHNYMQAHDDELAAFRAFAQPYPETILLVDTYDTLERIRRMVELARELGDEFRITEMVARGAPVDASGVGTRMGSPGTARRWTWPTGSSPTPGEEG